LFITRIFLFIFLFAPFSEPSNSSRLSAANVITVESSVSEMMAGYLKWIHVHPEVMHVHGTGASNSDSEPLIVKMPSIDLYSPTGVSLYHGTSSQGNALFLQDFPHNVHRLDAAKMTEIRPTIQEAMSICPELEPYKASIVGKKQYTIFAMTYPNAPIYEEQNKTVQQLKSRAQQLGLIVIEVQLHK
jgi:hypothetical protein